uniref:DUF4407 domain-containing protein n=1 Tax=Candidatus Kentrum sp. DK TaxID=2126562 RepID=A0A450T048_9GAMM|nr:MAG: protein of unknown function (DUF4407) [Candidatus Kentron sp. DK]
MSLRSLFWWIANVDRSIIKGCPETDQNRYCSLGVAIFIAAIIAALSFSYVIFLFVDPVTENTSINLFFTERFLVDVNIIATAFSLAALLLWFFLILHINRAFMPFIGPNISIREFFKKAWLRILLAAIISMSVTHPLILFFLSKDISENYKEQITERKAEEIAQTTPSGDAEQPKTLDSSSPTLEEKLHLKEKELDAENASIREMREDLRARISANEEKRKKKRCEIECQMFGAESCENVECNVWYTGEGKITARIEEEIKSLDTDISLLQALYDDKKKLVENREKEIESLNKKIEKEKILQEEEKEKEAARVEKEVAHISFAQSVMQASRILANSGFGMISIFFLIYLLFFSIEIFPIFVKFFFPAERYEEILSYRSNVTNHVKESTESIIAKMTFLNKESTEKAASLEELSKNPYADSVLQTIQDYLSKVGHSSTFGNIKDTPAYSGNPKNGKMTEKTLPPVIRPDEVSKRGWTYITTSGALTTLAWFIGPQKEGVDLLSTAGIGFTATVFGLILALISFIDNRLLRRKNDRPS